MTRRPPRLLGAIAALWTFLATSSPVPLHHCAMHGRVSNHAAAVSHAEAMDHAAGMAHVGHAAMPGMAHEADHSSAPAGHDDDCCRCLTCDGPPGAIALPALAFAVPAPPETTVGTARFDAARGPFVVRTPHVLPFGNGPPAV